MAINDAPLLVMDFETNGLSVETCCPVQLACLALDPVSLRVIPGSEFDTKMRPVILDTVDDTEEKRKALEINGLTKEDLADAPEVSVGIKRFVEHVKGLNKKKVVYAAGYNLRNFDLPLLDRLCRDHGLANKRGENPIFSRSAVFDLKDDIVRWFFAANDLNNISFDGLRRYFGLSSDGAHQAMVDVRQTAWMLTKMLRLYAELKPRIQFRGSAAATGGII